MDEKLQTLVDNLKKMQESMEILDSVPTVNMEDEIKKLLDYAILHGIIKGSGDVVKLSMACPELQDTITQAYDNHVKAEIEKKEKARKEATEQYDRRYAGTYNSLSEVPGYGTEWNKRCIPSGVIINRCGSGVYGNNRC